MKTEMPPDLLSQLEDLNRQALDEFSRLAISGARCALVDLENPLRLNFFSTAIHSLGLRLWALRVKIRSRRSQQQCLL